MTRLVRWIMLGLLILLALDVGFVYLFPKTAEHSGFLHGNILAYVEPLLFAVVIYGVVRLYRAVMRGPDRKR
jgi:hypothetical protein